jgi:O-antigen/teichoic acid export membrane protein
MGQAILWGSLYASAAAVTRWSNAVTLGLARFGDYNLVRLFQLTTWLTLTAVLLTLLPTATTYVAAFASSWALTAVISVTMARRAYQSRPHSANSLPAGFWRYAGLTHIAGQNFIDAWRVDILVAGLLLSTSNVALLAIAASYAAQVRIVSIAVAPLLLVRTAASPQSHHTTGRLAAFGGASAVLAAAMAAAAPTLIPWVFGSPYSSAVILAQLYCLGAFLSAVRSMYSEVLRGEGRVITTLVAELLVGAALLLTVGISLALGQEGSLSIALGVIAAQGTGLAAVAVRHRPSVPLPRAEQAC